MSEYSLEQLKSKLEQLKSENRIEDFDLSKDVYAFLIHEEIATREWLKAKSKSKKIQNESKTSQTDS